MSESNGQKYNIFLGIPNSGKIMPCCLMGISEAVKKHSIMLAPSQFGDIPQNFNILWCICLNNCQANQITHFAMAHTDILPGKGWLDTLIEEMDRVDADIMTGVVAIKDYRGLSTTGLRYPGIWGTRRFTMKEIHDLPETFCLEDCIHLDDHYRRDYRQAWEDVASDLSGNLSHDEQRLCDMLATLRGERVQKSILAINTGLWVCRFHHAGWTHAFPGFKSEHRIVWRDGIFQPEFDSEDWLFSDWAASQGLKVYATRKVTTKHVGAFEFGNDTVWGSMKTDEWRPKYSSVNGEESRMELVMQGLDEAAIAEAAIR